MGRFTCGISRTPAPTSGCAYDEVVPHVDRETDVLLETAFYGAAEALLNRDGQ